MRPIHFLAHGYGHFNAAHRVGPVSWPHFDLLWIHSGTVELRIGESEPMTRCRGQGVLIYPHTRFRGYAATRSARASIQHFEIDSRADAGQLPAPLKPYLKTSRDCRCFESGDTDEIDDQIDRAMHLAALPESDLVHDMRLAQLTLILGSLVLTQAARPKPGPYRDRFGALIDQLRKHPERKWALESMADAVQLSASHFRSLFRRQVGVSPGQFLQQLRVQVAAHLLRNTDEPIKTIAQRLGYHDLSHFYRQFQTHQAQTPNACRQSARPDA